jgi:hypothetical protein
MGAVSEPSFSCWLSVLGDVILIEHMKKLFLLLLAA